jgi:NADPH2:quinone reductase
MKAIRVNETGDSEVLRYEELPRPEPGPGEVRVKLAASGINYIDVYHRKGQYPGQTPFTLGLEGAGVVEALGAGVSEVSPGDRVAYTGQPGSYAEYVCVPVGKLVAVPERVELHSAAAVMLQGLTAHYLSHSTFPLQNGHHALVHAAAGGVGLLLVQMAKRRGAFVIGTVSTEEKADLARRAGADEVILYTEEDFESETKRITGGRGVEVVYDSVGETTFQKSLNCLVPRGYLVLYGQSSGPVAPVDPQILNSGGSLFLTRPSLGHYTADRSELLQRSGDLFEWMQTGELSVRIDKTFPLSDASRAHRYLEDRQTKGKLLLLP